MPKLKHERVVCFDVLNFEAVHEHDPDALQRAQRVLAEMGALPARVDWPSHTFCVTVTHSDLTNEQILAVLDRHGYKASLRKQQ